MHDESIFRATNTQILNQIGQPPPVAVLVALVDAIGGEPEVTAAVVDREEDYTAWEVFACRSNVFTHVSGRKEIDDWYGSAREAISAPQNVTATTRLISDLRSVRLAEVAAHPSYEGFQRECRAKWSLEFRDGHIVELNELARNGGRNIGAVARHMHQRFVGSA